MDVIALNPMPFVVVGTCLLVQQAGAASLLPYCQNLMNTLGGTAVEVKDLLFNSTVIPCLASKNFYCCKTPFTQEEGPWSLSVNGLQYLCDMMNPTTLVCPAPGATFYRQDPWTGSNAKCWTTPSCGATH